MDKAIHGAGQRTLSRLLREARELAGRRQVDVAERLNEPQSFVSKYESGERRLDLVELHTVCNALGTNLTSLVAQFEAALND